MSLEQIVRTGDVVFHTGKGIIERMTWSRYRHVALIYDSNCVFETDIWKRKASLRGLKTQKNKDIEIYRYKYEPFNYGERLKKEIVKMDRTPYSYYDIATNALLSIFHPKLRQAVIGKIGTKYAMVCSELTAHILYAVTHDEMYKGWKALQPVDLHDIMVKSGKFKLIFVGRSV